MRNVPRTPRPPCLGFAPVSLLALPLSIVPAHADEAAVQHYAISLAGGIHVPVDSDHESVYGSPLSFSLDVAGQVTENTWVDLGVGYRHASGVEFAGDPTFEIDGEVSYTIIPISLGVRTNITPAEEAGRPIRVYLAAGFMLAAARVSFPEIVNADRRSAIRPGLYFELRPEATVSPAWHVFARVRLEATGNAEVLPLRDLDTGGFRCQMGVSRWLGR